jgi:hypothetical protein
MRSRSGLISVLDFIHPDWQDCIFVSTNNLVKKTVKPLLKHIEANSYSDPQHQDRIICDLNGKRAVLLEQGDVYDWHSDSFSFSNRTLSNPRPGRYWTRIIYLTEGKPLEIGDWNSSGVLGADFDYPEPSNIIARIHPSPGKTITFPCFMVHRIQPTVDNDRWTFVDFVSVMKYNTINSSEYTTLAKRYFNEDFRSELLSSR